MATPTKPPAGRDAGSGPQPAETPSLPAAHKYDSAVGGLRRLLFGRALATSQAGHQKLPNFLALPIFSSDALSSNAYATEAILGVPHRQGDGRAAPVVGHRHRHRAAADHGRALVPADHLSPTRTAPARTPCRVTTWAPSASLVAGASLLIDYILTVAVSVAAGVAAMITAYPGLQPHLVSLCFAATLFVTLLNLRGVREAGLGVRGAGLPVYLLHPRHRRRRPHRAGGAHDPRFRSPTRGPGAARSQSRRPGHRLGT